MWSYLHPLQSSRPNKHDEHKITYFAHLFQNQKGAGNQKVSLTINRCPESHFHHRCLVTGLEEKWRVGWEPMATVHGLNAWENKDNKFASKWHSLVLFWELQYTVKTGSHHVIQNTHSHWTPSNNIRRIIMPIMVNGLIAYLRIFKIHQRTLIK